jgi:hypothetical protein
MNEGFDGTLDLTGSDPEAVGFPPVPSGQYEAHVAKAEWRSTENIDGSKALPHNTPYLNLGIQISNDEEERDGQRVAGMYAGFAKLFVPPADYDPGKAQQMKNRMANFLNAIGEDWQKKGYKMPDVEQLIGRELTVVARKKRDSMASSGFSNEIEGFKPAGSSVGAGDSGLLV